MNSIAKKIWNIAFKVVAVLLIAFTVAMMVFTIFTVTTVDKNDRSIFGIKFYIVTSGSMSLSENNADMDVHFDPGDIIIVSNVDDPAAMEKGDIISFVSTNPDNYGETVTHMINRRVYDDETKMFLGYETFGTNTGAIDEALVEPSYVLGEYSGRIPQLGNFFAFMKTTPGYIVCILIPFLLLILYNGVNVIRLFRRYRKEQNEIMEAEKAEIAAERKQNEDMMRELLALKAQLEQKSEPQAPKAEPEAPAAVVAEAPKAEAEEPKAEVAEPKAEAVAEAEGEAESSDSSDE